MIDQNSMMIMLIGVHYKTMKTKRFQLTRDVTKQECSWLDKDYKKGDIVFEYPLYVDVSDKGIACSDQDSESPWYELPKNALLEIS